MTVTPRATPVVKRPVQSPPASERVTRNQLRAPIVVVSNVGEWELESGELVIGRDPDAHVVVDDPLVSRFHARIVVDHEGLVTLEDLQSANGVFVNGVKLSRPAVLLGEGDRFLVGTTEISVFAFRASAMVPLGQPAVTVPLTKAAVVPSAPNRPVAVTGRADAIELVGQLAEQLMESGHPLEAARVLSVHLQDLRKGASAGLSVPVRILESATRYALRLHRWTQRSIWIDYVLELHVAISQVPSEICLRELEQASCMTADWDTAMLGYFVQTLERRPEPLTLDETARLRRLEELGATRSSKTIPLV